MTYLSSLDPDTISFRIEVESSREVETETPFDGGYSSWSARLIAYDEGRQHEESVGTTSLALCRDARWNPNFWDRMDEENADMEVFGSALSSTSSGADEDLWDDETFKGDVLVFDRVTINGDWRRRDLSFTLVDAAAEVICPGALLALQPMPAGEQTQENISRLQRHWTRGGFTERRLGVFTKMGDDLDF